MVHVVNMAFQSINNVTIPTAINKPHLPKNRFSKVTQYAGRVSANTRLRQLCWGEWEVGTAISCTERSQLAGLMYYPKGGISTSNSPSLQEAVLQEAVLQEAVSVFCYHACTCAVHVSSVEIRNYSVDHINELQLRVGLTYMCMEV